MRFSCRITKAKNTDTYYSILSALPRQKWLRERVSVLRYGHVACLVKLCCISVLYYTKYRLFDYFIFSVPMILASLLEKAKKVKYPPGRQKVNIALSIHHYFIYLQRK